MLFKSRQEILADFRAQIAQGKILVGVGAGTGITAKCSEKAGVDMLIIYNSGRFRMAGRGSLSGLLAYGDANKIVVEMGYEVLPVVKKTPVLAGVCGTDPFRVMDIYLKELKAQGFNGVQNFPTVGLIDGVFRQNLEETGMGYGLEVDMIRKAHELDMVTCPYVFDAEQARAMAEAGADCLVAHMGLTTKGSIGAETAKTLDDCIPLIREIIAAGREVNPDIMVICHGGPIADPEDFCYHLNALLPYDIAVQRLRRVRNDAHARFDALEREYKYYISPRKNPFNRDTAYQLAWPLDLCRMNEAAALLPGEQDFTSFCKLHSDNKTNLCRIARAGWQRQDDGLLVFTIAADRFLRNMVRAVVGTLLDVGRGKLTAEDFRSVIAGRDRSLASSSAPPQGLFLSRVTYPETIYISDDTN